MLEQLTQSRETAEQYQRWSAPYRDNELALSGLVKANRWLRLLCYVLYPVLLAICWLDGTAGQAALPAWGSLFWRVLLASSLGFIFETLLRAAINAPRPYEVLGIKPLIRKQTRGKSFPSRHAFSVFVIATCWLGCNVWVGIALMCAGAVLCWVRVLAGVHFPRDVVAGAVLGIACGALGLLL